MNMRIILFYVISICGIHTYGALVERQQDINVVIGQMVTLQCKPDQERSEVRWRHLRTGEDTASEVFVFWENRIVREYRSRFKLADNPDGWVNLTITNVTYSDAGRYRCSDEVHGLVKSSMNLTVFDIDIQGFDNSNKDGVVDFGVDCTPSVSSINMTCSIIFAGNVPPTDVFQWKREGSENEKLFHTAEIYADSSSTENKYKAASTLELTANTAMSGYRYTCYIRQTIIGSSGGDVLYSPSWTSSALDILYLRSANTDAVPDNPCPVETNMRNCNQIWTNPLGHSLNKNPNKTQTCTTECKIGGATCRVSRQVIVAENEKTNQLFIIVGCSALVAVFLLAVVIVAIIKRRALCSRTNPQSAQNHDDKHKEVAETVTLLPLKKKVLHLDMGDRTDISGIVTSDKYKTIYILCRTSPSILQFSSESSYTRMNNIDLPDLGNPNDMSGCTKHSCLYVVYTNGKIFRVSMADNSVVEMDFTMEGPPYTLSVTSDGTLVMAHNRIKPDRFKNSGVVAPEVLMLNETINSNSFTKTITKLPGEWLDSTGASHRVLLHHALQLESGNLLISYGEDCSYVCEINRITGTFIRSSNPTKFEGSRGHLSVCSEEYVYLVRSEGLIKFNNNLEEISVEKELESLKKDELTRLCCFGKDSFIIGTRKSGAYIIF